MSSPALSLLLQSLIYTMLGEVMQLFAELDQPCPAVGPLIVARELTVKVSSFSTHLLLSEVLIKGCDDLASRRDVGVSR